MSVKAGPAAIRVRAKVTGRVQGVYYRASTLEQASGLGLVGWVRNTEDGAVELEAQGPAERVDALIEWCRRGPPAAQVRAVDVHGIEPVGNETAFRVRRERFGL